jgi:sugar/nucleoside kinase (ribokinase family)
MKKIICVGSATRDIFLGITIDDKSSEKICLKAGSKVYTDSYRETVGGGAVNVGTGLKKLGYRSFIFARTDKTVTGKWIQKQIGKLKLKKNYLQQNGKIPSETSIIIADSIEQDRTILRSGDSVENFNLSKACEKFREHVEWIYLSSQKKNHLENMDILVNFANEKRAKIAFNPSSYQIKKNADEVLVRLESIHILFVNLDEAVALLKEKIKTYRQEGKVSEGRINDLMKNLLNFGVKIIALTDGANGAWVASNIKGELAIFYSPAESIKNITDTTGAGDAFASGFLGLFVANESELKMEFSEKLQRALAGGLANSASVISEIGAVNGLLKPGKLKKRVKKIIK